jgi:hypothetical protein
MMHVGCHVQRRPQPVWEAVMVAAANREMLCWCMYSARLVYVFSTRVVHLCCNTPTHSFTVACHTAVWVVWGPSRSHTVA